MENSSPDAFKNLLRTFLLGYCQSQAMLEDYARVIARLEESTEEMVKERIKKRTEELLEEIRQGALKKMNDSFFN